MADRLSSRALVVINEIALSRALGKPPASMCTDSPYNHYPLSTQRNSVWSSLYNLAQCKLGSKQAHCTNSKQQTFAMKKALIKTTNEVSTCAALTFTRTSPMTILSTPITCSLWLASSFGFVCFFTKSFAMHIISLSCIILSKHCKAERQAAYSIASTKT